MSEKETVEVDSNALAIVTSYADSMLRNIEDEDEAERLAEAIDTVYKNQ